MRPNESPIEAAAIESQASQTNEKQHVLVRVALLILVCGSVALFESARLYSATDEVWGSLRAGLWILQNHTVPRMGIFSQSSTSEWIDLHWLYQVVLAVLSKILGLRAIPLASMLVKIPLVAAILLLAMSGRTSIVGVTAIAVPALAVILRSDPVPLSALFFALELWIVSRVRLAEDARWQWVLIPLFCVWANADPGFVLGACYLALWALTASLEMARGKLSGTIAGRTWMLLAAACLATVVSPYGVAVWREAWTELYGQTAIRYIAEARPMAFRSAMDFVALLYVMGSMSALGFRRKHELLDLAAIAIAMPLAFRFPREFWMLTLCCVSALSNASRQLSSESSRTMAARHWRVCLAGLGVILVLLGVSVVRAPGDLKTLSTNSGANLPIAACDAIRTAALPKPIFNVYQWGDFLTWYLPEYPVAIDSRVALYGDAQNKTYFDLIEGRIRLEEVPMFSGAKTVLLNRASPLAGALVNVPQLSSQFRVVYGDENAIVFVRNQ